MANIPSNFAKPNDPVLWRKADAIAAGEFGSDSLQGIIKKLYDIAAPETADKSRKVMVGLAAPQIGISKRIILVDVKADGTRKFSELKCFINPEIAWQSEETSEWYEACYSTGNTAGIVERPTSVKIKYHDKTGKEILEGFSGYVARIFQHEIDHLDGKVFIDHISDPEKLHSLRPEQFPEYRDQQGWKNWPHKYQKSDWEKQKSTPK